MFISSVIFEGEWSFKPTSTASWLILVHSSTTTIYPRHPNSIPATPHNAEMSPSPLMRDVGSTTKTPGCAKQMAATPAPPLSKGMWAGLYLMGGIGEISEIGEGMGDGSRCNNNGKEDSSTLCNNDDNNASSSSDSDSNGDSSNEDGGGSYSSNDDDANSSSSDDDDNDASGYSSSNYNDDASSNKGGNGNGGDYSSSSSNDIGDGQMEVLDCLR